MKAKTIKESFNLSQEEKEDAIERIDAIIKYREEEEERAKMVGEVNEKDKPVKKEKLKLSEKDKKVLNLLIGENLNEAKIEWKKFFPKFKKAAAKGLISVALLTTLMSSNAFGQDQKDVMQKTMNQIEMSDDVTDDTEGGGEGDYEAIGQELQSASEDLVKYSGNRNAANFLDHLSQATHRHGIDIGVENVGQSGGGDSMAIYLDFDGPGAEREVAALEKWIAGSDQGLEKDGDHKFKYDASGERDNPYSVEVSEKDGHARVIIRTAYFK